MSLTDTTFNASDYESEGFKAMLENELPALKASAVGRVRTISPVDASRFEYDLYGLLRVIHVDDHYHWITMRINGLMSPCDYRANMTTIYIPDTSLVDSLYSLYLTIPK